MKDVKSKSGETEKQPREYAPDGPVRLAPSEPDKRGRLNGDGSKNESVAERPVYSLTKELEDLERTDPEVRAAAENLERVKRKILASKAK
jgi:hypothetical protein